jgi:hypothetical protein
MHLSSRVLGVTSAGTTDEARDSVALRFALAKRRGERLGRSVFVDQRRAVRDQLRDPAPQI